MRPLLGLAALSVAASAGAAQADPELARHLAAECVTCHITTGDAEGIPNIVGLPKDVFISVFDHYRTHERNHALMNVIASRYDDDEIESLAAYFAALGTAEDH
jgi:cytochrome c553